MEDENSRVFRSLKLVKVVRMVRLLRLFRLLKMSRFKVLTEEFMEVCVAVGLLCSSYGLDTCRR